MKKTHLSLSNKGTVNKHGSITAGGTSFSDFDNDVKMLFSEWSVASKLGTMVLWDNICQKL